MSTAVVEDLRSDLDALHLAHTETRQIATATVRQLEGVEAAVNRLTTAVEGLSKKFYLAMGGLAVLTGLIDHLPTVVP